MSGAFGSITNGFLALRSDYGLTDTTGFVHEVVAPLAKRFATDGTVFADRASRWVKGAIVALGATWVTVTITIVLVAVVGRVAAWGSDARGHSVWRTRSRSLVLSSLPSLAHF